MAANFGNAKGSRLLKEVAMKNSALNNGTIVVHVDIDKLHDNPDNTFLFGMEREDVLHTAEGIKLNGFHGAIEVFDTGDGFYEIYSGHIRKYGAIEAGMEKIPCFISQMPDPAQKRRLLIGANLYGRNRIKSTNPILTGRQLKYHKETLKMENFKGDIREQLAKEFGISGSQVHKYMALTELIDPLQEIIGKGLVPFSLIYSAKTFSEADQQKLYENIMEVLKDHEPLSQQEVKRCLYIVSGEEEKPLPGQMNISNYDVPTEAYPVSDQAVTVDQEKETESAYDRLPVQDPENCNTNCFYCRNKNCNGSQEKREHCIFDAERECNMYNVHEVAIDLGMDCKSLCCRYCDEECGARCNHYLHVSTTRPQEQNIGATESTDQEEKVVHDEQLKIPSASRVYSAYQVFMFNREKINNYYDLKDFLIGNYGKTYSGHSDKNISFNCSPRGIKINTYDEITWTMFLDILSEMVPLDKERASSLTSLPDEPETEVNKVSEIEKKIYKLESDMSDHTDSISWSNPEEAKKIMRSLIAMLEDEIESAG